MSGSDFQISSPFGLLLISHLHPHLSDRHDVMDFVLDQTRGSSSQGHPGGHLIAHTINTTREQSKIIATGVIHKGDTYIRLLFYCFCYLRSYSLSSLTVN